MDAPKARGGPVPKDPLSRLPQDVLCVRKVRRAASIAGLNAISFTIFAVASAQLMMATMFSGGITIAAVTITVTLGLVAWYEFRGRKMLKQLDVAACRLLGWNQLALLGVLVAYCSWSIVWGYLYPSSLAEGLAEHPELLEPYSEQDRRDLMELVEIVEEFWPTLIAVIYGTIIFLSVIYQGWNAWYYFSRKRFVEECRAMEIETPQQHAH